MRTRTTILAAASSALLLACGGETPPAEESYDVRTLGSYQDYLVTPVTGPTYTYRNHVVVASAGGFTRKHTYDNSTNYAFNMLVVSGGSEYVEKGETYSGAGALLTTTTYTPGFLILSPNTAPGSSATSVSAVTGTAGSSTYTREVVVDGVESVTVPVGTFDALKTTSHITSTTGEDSYLVYWWVQGIGRVKMATYSAAPPGSVTTFELTDHGMAPVP